MMTSRGPAVCISTVPPRLSQTCHKADGDHCYDMYDTENGENLSRLRSLYGRIDCLPIANGPSSLSPIDDG